jgi:hypothetical protein
MMVNYLYDLATIEANHEIFLRDGTVIRSEVVEALLHPQQPATQQQRPRIAAALEQYSSRLNRRFNRDE